MVLIYQQICANNAGRMSIMSNYSLFILILLTQSCFTQQLFQELFGTKHSEPLYHLTISHRKLLSRTYSLLFSSRQFVSVFLVAIQHRQRIAVITHINTFRDNKKINDIFSRYLRRTQKNDVNQIPKISFLSLKTKF